MSNRGITLLAVTVIIIVMIILATTGIVAGNKLILNSKELTESQIIENVREAVVRKKAEYQMQGTITPIGVGFPGKANPSIGDGTVVAEGWYQLDEEELKQLGVNETNERMLINYEYEEVLPMRSPNYFERYEVITFLRKVAADVASTKGSSNPKTYIGEKLTNLTAHGTMYVNEETGEAFGNDWYYVKPENYSGDYADFQKYIKHPYVVNYRNGNYEEATNLVKKTISG